MRLLVVISGEKGSETESKTIGGNRSWILLANENFMMQRTFSLCGDYSSLRDSSWKDRVLFKFPAAAWKKREH